MIKSLVNLERLADIDACADKFLIQDAKGDINGIHASIKGLKRDHAKRSPHIPISVCDDNGNLSQTYSEERAAFRQHFSSLMSGEVCTLESIIDSDRSDNSFRFHGVDPNTCWMSIPSPTHVVNMSLRSKTHKAPGECLITCDAHHKFANAVATVQFPLIIKTFVRAQPSIAWRGGMICEIYKKKGPRHLRTSFRDVLLADDSGKHVSAAVRRMLLPRAKLLVHATQYGGGFNGGETSFTNLNIRCAADLCKSAGTSFAILYADVVSAFARMLRRAVFDVSDGDEIWISHLRASGFCDTDIIAIRDMVAQLASWDIDCDGNIIAPDPNFSLTECLAKQWFKCTWVSQEGIGKVIRNKIGCMAGTPLADLLFTVVVSRVLLICRKSIVSDGLQSIVTVDGKSFELSDASFVDDCAQPVSDVAHCIVDKTTMIASVLDRVFSCFQLELNFLEGKSEATVLFRGPGKKKALLGLTRSARQSSFSRCNGSEKILRWVHSYKHVGTKSDIGSEVSVRCAFMRQSFASMRKHIFRNPHVSVRRKSIILSTYILTKGTFQCSVWPTLPAPLMKRFNACIISMYREITGCTYDKVNGTTGISDSDLMFNHELVLPATILKFSRLSLFGRLCAKAPESLFSMVHALADCDDSWTSLVRSDLVWLCNSPDFSSCSSYSFQQWCDSIKDSPIGFKRMLSKYVKLRIANIPDIVTTPASPNVISSFFSCSECEYTCNTFQKLSLHLFKKHGIRNVWRRYVYLHTHCPVCLRLFWSRERLINHIRYRSVTCKHNMILRGFKCTEEEANVVDESVQGEHTQLSKAGKRRHAATDPAIRLCGPLLPILLPDHILPSKHHALGLGHNHL